MHGVKKSGFTSLVRNLTDTQGKQERTGDIRATNCIGDDVEMATMEVVNTPAMNTRSRADKTYHLIVSFRDGEENSMRPNWRVHKAANRSLKSSAKFFS